MNIDPPEIIQGGMGAGVSNWRLARAVAQCGQLGVVSGTALDVILLRRLQDGDPGGHMRRALAAFPFPGIARRIVEQFYLPDGRPGDAPYRTVPMHSVLGQYWSQALCVAGNFVEVFLAREGHGNPVGINYLEKIQFPHLPSLYGAMLAGVAVVLVGAGIPLDFPEAMNALAKHRAATYTLRISGALAGETTCARFDPRAMLDSEAAGMALPELVRPDFLPIVASETLAAMLLRRAPDGISGFVVEGARAGGHNAPPRGRPQLSPAGEPVYGPRDVVDPAAMLALGKPFWLAGAYGSAEGLRAARKVGAAGVQVGTAFALCTESGLLPAVRRRLVTLALTGQARVFTDPAASPTGFPFKVVQLEGSLSDAAVCEARHRVCDLGFLREPYRRADGTIGYRCPAEPEASFAAKAGDPAATAGRKCLCNALVANVGMPQRLADGSEERCLITLGDDFAGVGRFCEGDNPDFSAADVIRTLLA